MTSTPHTSSSTIRTDGWDSLSRNGHKSCDLLSRPETGWKRTLIFSSKWRDHQKRRVDVFFSELCVTSTKGSKKDWDPKMAWSVVSDCNYTFQCWNSKSTDIKGRCKENRLPSYNCPSGNCFSPFLSGSESSLTLDLSKSKRIILPWSLTITAHYLLLLIYPPSWSTGSIVFNPSNSVHEPYVLAVDGILHYSTHRRTCDNGTTYLPLFVVRESWTQSLTMVTYSTNVGRVGTIRSVGRDYVLLDLQYYGSREHEIYHWDIPTQCSPVQWRLLVQTVFEWYSVLWKIYESLPLPGEEKENYI